MARWSWRVIAVAAAIATVSSSARAATTVGATDPAAPPTGSCIADTVHVQATSDGTGASYTIPFDAVITSWRHQAKAGSGSRLALIAWRRFAGEPVKFTVVGKSAESPVEGGNLNSFGTRIAVKAGDRLGLRVPSGSDVSCMFAGDSTGDWVSSAPGDAAVGETRGTGPGETLVLNVAATIEPDADGDGYGDETEDQCPAKAATTGPCSGVRTHVVLGESVAGGVGASPGKGMSDLIFAALRERGVAHELVNRARGGSTSSDVRYGGQLQTAVGDIDGPSDTTAVTISIGGNDATLPGCPPIARPSCPFEGNLRTILATLNAALAADPGDEITTVMAYYNPAIGTSREAEIDRNLLGSDLAAVCRPPREAMGLNDLIRFVAADAGWLVADAHPAIKAGGARFLHGGGDIHPNDLGHRAIADAFLAANPPPTALCDVTPPVIKISNKSKQDIDKLSVVVTVDELAWLQLTATVKMPGRKKPFKAPPVTQPLQPGVATRVRVQFSKKVLRLLKSFLDGGKLTTNITIAATDVVGNGSGTTLKIKLKD